MDQNALQPIVEQAVMAKINAREPFTTVDISHPIIADLPNDNVRHREVRSCIDAMINQGVFDNSMYTSSSITVYPKPGMSVDARLFHPDDPTFDPSSYTATNQELNRTQKTGSSNIRLIQMDSDGDDGSQASNLPATATQTSGGHAITKQCYVQTKQLTLSIPKIIVGHAKFAINDPVDVQYANNMIVIKKSSSGSQKVDAEGRIRLHGSKISNRTNGTLCTAMVVEPVGDDPYIQIQ